MKLKTLTYSIIHFIVAFSVSFILTKDFTISSTIALIEPVIQTVAYYFHEKAWLNYLKNRDLFFNKKYKFSFSHLFRLVS